MCFYFYGHYPRFRFMNIVYVFVADTFVCVIPGSSPGMTKAVVYFLFYGHYPRFRFMNIVYVLVADTFVCVIPGPDPGIQVIVHIKMSLWGNGPRPAPGLTAEKQSFVHIHFCRCHSGACPRNPGHDVQIVLNTTAFCHSGA